jgi:hypothetical protein
MYSKETGKNMIVDTGSRRVRNNFARNAGSHLTWLDTAFKRSGVDSARFTTGTDYVKPLLGLFKARGAKR